MHLGVQLMGAGPMVNPTTAARVARQAEAAGFESLWAGEHVVLPDPPLPPPFSFPPHSPSHDPLMAFAHLAGHTQRIRFGLGIIILPLRNPVVLAKQVAGLDVLSGGRLLFGVGIGYMEKEYKSVGVPFEERGRRMDEYLEALRALWLQDKPTFHGRYVSFDGINSYPRPQQPGGPPIVVAGRSEAAYRRAVRCGHGWYGGPLNLEQTAECLAGLKKAASEVERPAHLGTLQVNVGPLPEKDLAPPAALERYAALGIHRLILWPMGPWAWNRLDGSAFAGSVATWADLVAQSDEHNADFLLRFLDEYGPSRVTA